MHTGPEEYRARPNVCGRFAAFVAEAMGIPNLDPSATPQQRLAVEVQGLPIDLPAGTSIRRSEAFPEYVRQHRERNAACTLPSAGDGTVP